MSELIDREETVKQIVKMGEMLGLSHDRDVTIAIALFVQDDKSAFPTVERPHGVWIRHIDDLYPEESTEECSVCHEEQMITGNDDNFCPNCGADMREGEAK